MKMIIKNLKLNNPTCYVLGCPICGNLKLVSKVEQVYSKIDLLKCTMCDKCEANKFGMFMRWL